MTTIVYGSSDDPRHIDAALRELDAQGHGVDEISILAPESLAKHPTVHEIKSKAPEGTVSGGVTGAAVGGLVGLLAGIGTLAIPGLGVLIAAGPILATLSGMAVGGAAGSIVGALIGMGIPEIEAKKYERALKEGRTVIAVHCNNGDTAKRVKEVLSNHDFSDISTGREAKAKAKAER